MRRRTDLILIGSALVLVLAACSKGGVEAGATKATSTTSSTSTTVAPKPGPSRSSYSFAMNDKLIAPIGQDDGCVSGRMVDAVGVERLNAAKVTPEQFTMPVMFTLIHVTQKDRDAFEQAATTAFEACGTSRKLATDFMKTGYESMDVTPFVDCAVGHLTPRLASMVVDNWSGTVGGSFTDGAYSAISLSTEECPDYQVAVTLVEAQKAGYTYSSSGVACLRQKFTEQAGKHRLMTSEEFSGIISGCD
ncbi:hypothetical protein [Aquihabitans sp. McL0605]|uniref:hypothetical protein n=1 Tax=Aquihabitans sp. McL0605 TaxID=3415671 RepID=UPI003CEC8CE1